VIAKSRSRIRMLVLRALARELSLSQLYAEWPDDVGADPFAEAVYDDIESVVEHFPVDQDRLLEIDLDLIDSGGSSDDLVRVRKILLKRANRPNAEEIRRLVSSTSQDK